MGTRFLDYEVFNSNRYEVQFFNTAQSAWSVESYYYSRAQARFECKRLKRKRQSMKFRVVKIVEQVIKTTMSA